MVGLIFFLALSPAHANTFGLAMHGAAKYDAGAKNLDYVNPDAPKGGTLKQAAIGTFDTLNPFSIKGTAAQGLNLVYDRLMGRVWDEPFTMYPLIAQSADIPADRSSVTFHLNPKAKFQDGSPITADDVLFSWKTLKDSGRPNMRRVYKLASEAKKIDNLTVRFTFGPGHDRETVMIFAMMPVLPEKWWQGRSFDATVLEKPLLTGPYKIAAFDPGHRIVFERDPDYWAKDLLVNKGLYNFDRVVYDYYRDDTIAFEAFKAGNTDLRREFNAGKWSAAYDFPSIKRGDVIAESLPHHRPEQARGLIYNTRREPFNDRRVREALEYVLDFDWVNKTLFHGQYKRIGSYFPNADLAAAGAPDKDQLAILEPFRKSLPPEIFRPMWQPPATGGNDLMRTDLRKADELLKQAGWIVIDGKRVRTEDHNHPFHFEITLGAREDEKIALTFIGGLQRLGIEASVRILDAAAFTGRLNTYDYDMVLYYWLNTLSPGSEQVVYWGCDAAKQEGRFNYAGICDPAIDALSKSIADATTEQDLKARAAALDRLLMWGYYMIPLYYSGNDNVAYRSFIAHPKNMPLYGMVLETWWASHGNK